MKRLLIALVAAVAVSTVFAKLTDTQSFEESFSDFVPSMENQDDSALVAYDGDVPSFNAPYNFNGFGDKFLSLDTGDATLWRTNEAAAAYFDMVMQFNPSATAPTIDDDTKIAVFMNSDGKLVVIDAVATNVTETALNAGEWYRLTIAATTGGFQVRINGDLVGTYASRCGAAEINTFGLKGTGSLDDFVARTTDPFIENPVATIGGEGYASFADAYADDPTATIRLEANASMPAPLAYGQSVSVKLNDHTLSNITTGSLIAFESTTGDVTTYTAGFFPRTSTAGQDGTAANPYEIADADDLIALQDAILADAATFASKSYIQTASIVMDGDGQGGSLPDFYGIGWFKSSSSYASLPAGLASASTDLPFAGTYDGAGYTISKVTLVRHNYAGVFNNVEGTVKNLTVENIGFSGTCGEWGCAIVGNAQGSALLENLTSQTWGEGPWGDNANHNVAGIVVRAQNAVTIRGCVNNAPITSVSRRLGGIIAFTGNTAPTGTITIDSCTNNAALTVNTGSNAGDRGIGGIISRPESVADGLVIRNCANFGVLTNNGVPAKVGAIAGELDSQNYVDDGGNTYLATLGPVGNYNGQTVTGLIYALPVTIDNNDYLTTVKQADLAAGNTYTLLRGVDSPAAVYTFDAPGWIAFKGSSEFGFDGIVGADTTTLVLTEDYSAATSTKTYTAVAGKASVDDFAYATFQEALTAINDSSTTQDYVTLLDDATYTFSVGDTLKVKQNGKQFTWYRASEDVVVSCGSIIGGVATYVAEQGIVTCNGSWYASLLDAVSNATSGDTIYLRADGVIENISLPTGVAFAINGHTYGGTVTAAENGYVVVENNGVYVVVALPDYSPWTYASGIVVWRATSGQLFHASTVADVAADGTIGSTYNLGTEGHPWNVFASTVNGQPNSNYTSPGKTLVFDESGYNASSDAQFAPLSFGGMWVKALQAENTPYCITDNKTDSSDRKVELGAVNANTYFKFDESFTFNRNSATKVLGTATVEIAAGKTFTINARANKGAVVDSGNTLVLKGEGTLAVVGGLSVDGTLDLSATTRPAIAGDVSLIGTIVLPAGTEVSAESPFTVCTGTLSGLNVLVKIGDAEAVEKSFSAVNGAITAFDDPIYTFTENYPTIVPAGKTYTFVGGDSAENTVELDARDVRGTLKTRGYFSFTNYKSGGAAAVLDVESGSLTLHPGNNWFNGTLTVEAGATFVNGKTDAVQYGGTFTANIYGTLSMGETRWSLGSNNTLNFHEGCTVTGSGQSSNGTFDWIENATGTLNVDGDVNLAAPIRIRGGAKVNFNVDTTDQKGLTLAATIGSGAIVKKGAGLLKFTTNPPYAIEVENGAFTFAVDATPTITYSAKPGTGTTMSMWYATQDTWKGTVVIGDLNAPTALPLNAYGNANSKIVLTGTTGNCYLNGTTTVAAELVVGTNANNVVEFNNGSSNQVGTFNKVSGPGTLKLVGWGGCSAATYVVNTANFTGTLAVHNAITRSGGGTFTIRIGNIVTTRTTNPGDCVLPIANTAVENATGTVVYDLANATVNGDALDLEAKDDGIYVAAAPTTVTITVPAVANTTVTVEVGGETIGTEAGDYDLEPGSVVTVTYAAAEGYQISGQTVYTIDTANSETTFTPSAQVAQIVAYIGETPYTSLASAFSAVDEGDTLTLVGSAVTLAEDVTVTNSYTLAGDAEGTTVTGSGKIYLTGSAELTLDATLTSVGNQFWFSSKDAKLTFPTAGTPPTVRPYTAGGCQTGTTVNGDGTTTYYQYLFLQLLVGSTNVSLAYENGDPLAQKQVYEGDEIVFTATPAEGYENPVVTVNGELLAPVDGKYTVVVGTVNVAIQATATAIPPVAQVVHGETATPYLTLAEAVAAAEAGDTIRLLGNLELDARVEPNKSMTIDLGGYTLSRTGTGGNGSVIDVKSGNVVITNGVIDCTQDDTAIVADGVYAITARSGANVTLGGLTVTVNSQAGACVYPFGGAQVTILSGTYANTTTDVYQYGRFNDAGLKGMAVNQANVATQLITIYGGSFKQINPALGDDSWTEGTFLASGYAATWNPSTGYYDVAKYVQPSVIDPTSGTEIVVDPTKTPEEQAADAQAAAAALDVQKTADADAEGVDQTTWNSYFTKTAEKVNDAWVAKAELNPAVVLPVDGAEETPLTDMLESVAAMAIDTTEEASASVPTKAGLYYWIEGATEVGAASYTPGTALRGNGTTQKLSRPTLDGENGKAFFKVCVGIAAPTKD